MARVREITAGKGVDLVLDSVGGPQFSRNFEYLGTLGLLINYGQLGGPAEGDMLKALRGHRATSPGLRCFTMHAYDKAPEIRRAATRSLVDLLAARRIKPPIHDRLPLSEARRAHELFDSGRIMGKLLLKP
jgi:NADPH:quinone reductase